MQGTECNNIGIPPQPHLIYSDEFPLPFPASPITETLDSSCSCSLMASLPPCSDLAKCVSDPPRPHARHSIPRAICVICRMSDDSKFELWCFGVFMIAVSILLVLVSIFFYLICILVGPEYPEMKVAELTVSNLAVTALAGVIWNATLLAERSEDFGNLFFREVECFVYYHWDDTQPLALASAKPFVLRSIDKTVIKVKITMEKPVEGVVEDMNREQRSVGTVAVGLGLRMQGTYVLGSWWKREYGEIVAYCDNVKVAFANSTGEGRLVTGDTGGSLPSCSYNRVDPEDAAIMFL